MFDHGTFYGDSNSSLGKDTVPGQYLVKSLHVQDRGVFELHSTDKKLTSRLSLTNLTVSDAIESVSETYFVKSVQETNNDIKHFQKLEKKKYRYISVFLV